MVVRVGMWRTDQDPAAYATRGIAAWLSHPAWAYYQTDSASYDLALVLLDAPVTRVPLAALPPHTPKPGLPVPAGTTLTAIGWGALGPRDEQGDDVFPTTLQEVQLTLQPLAVCDAYWPGGGPLAVPWGTNSGMCAGNPPANNRDVCGGDSGGALFLPAAKAAKGRDVVLGVVRCVRRPR